MNSKIRTWIGILFVILLLTVIFAALSISGCSEPRPMEPTPTVKWDDTRTFTELLTNSDYKYRSVIKTSEMSSIDGSDSLLIIIGAEAEFRSSDVNAIQDFVSTGGWVLIADDGTNANRVSSIWNINYQGSKILTGSLGFDRNVSFVYGDGNIEGSSYNLLFNTPTGFDQLGESEVLARYPYSSIDVIDGADALCVFDNNSNYIIDNNDQFAQECPFITKLRVGPGGLVFVSDTGIFCDQIFSKYDNRAFMTKLISSLITDDGTIYYDQSHQTSLSSGHKSMPE